MPARNKIKSANYKRILKYIIFGTNVVALLLLIASSFAWTVSPNEHIVFSYLGLFFPFVLAVNIAYLILWIISFNWKLLLISLCVLAFCWKPIKTYFPFHFITKDIPKGSIKFLTYNVRGFNGTLKDKNGNSNPIFTYIRDSKADIVCIQEFVAMRNHDGNIATKAELKKILRHYPYQSVVGLAASNKFSIYGLACYSKYPIIKTFKIPFSGNTFNGSAIFRIKINDKVISVVNNHLESNKITSEDKQLYQQFLEKKNSDMIGSIAHNIRNRLGVAYRLRASQVDSVALYVAKEKTQTDAMIVCGDFNDTPISYAYHKMKNDLYDSYAETGRGPGITYHENHFLFRIDYILHDDNFKAYNAKVGKKPYSDHYPLMTYLKLND
ncbi:MAG: Endonuclease/Exonuclease/phosphatase family [Bacteroidetes bacterium]|nr:Endonuclease/Exonuclease/phosphatase family [Bacteroidota bacterium]